MKILALNKRARFDYDISEKLIAGLVLTGPETKSAKAGHLSLKGSFVAIKAGEAYLTNASINPYPQTATHIAQEPLRSRKLLLHQKELDKLVASKQAGLSIVPLAAGVERGYVKLEIAIGRGKKLYDKRQSIKKRDSSRELDRTLKQRSQS
ncbi:MAG TPA: SsrA-binding protein SmpB [Candidatus Saccharimonadales bacterium]|nr:SsrA-binding protein SmpB [Candidatus Saccharimonadales bacterium]